VFGLATASPSPPIQIAQTAEGDAITAPGQQLTVAGWGATTPFQDKPPGFLKSTLVNTVNKKQCGKVYGRGFIGGTMLCAKGAKLRPGSKRSLRTSPCAGDSGGPLIGTLPTTGEARLVGLVSFGPRICGLPFAPVSYAKTFDPSGLEFLGQSLVTPLP
jgi:secreted trypsin-like serine protease